VSVIGTAGHIDHGKTSLVHALTGIDTDRLKEEKARGITIELGFAHLALPSGRVVGVVDVPGHERFVRAMVAGAVGLDLVVLVVAADEGVMPQTREHLDICRLLGVARGVVALTKIDAAAPELSAIAEDDVRAALAGGPFAGAPIVPCSAKTGEGLAELRAAIEAGLEASPGPTAWPPSLRGIDGPVRLPVDRVFTMKGFGSVVTGTLWSGVLAPGDEVELLPGPSGRAKVRGVQVHGQAVERVQAGQRVAVNLPLPREALARGQVLGRAGVLEPSRVFDAQIDCLPSTRRPLRRRTRLLLHAGTQQTEATVRLIDVEELPPGGRAFVEVAPVEGLVLYPGDRFVLRGQATQRDHGTTLGGGVVLRVLGQRSTRRAPTTMETLARNLDAHRRGDVEARVLLELERAGEGGLDRAALLRRVPFGEAKVVAATEKLLSRREAFRFDRLAAADLGAAAYARLRQRALEAIAAHHAAHPLEPGLPREALRATVTDEPRLLHLVVEGLIADRELLAELDRVRLPAHDPSRGALADDVATLGERVAKALRDGGLSPPRPEDLPTVVTANAREIGQALEVLGRQRRAVKVQSLWFDADAVATLRTRLTEFLRAHGQITPSAWKELTGASRKYSIPLAEHFDAERLTLRVGDVRKLRG
jgi:selenocysteine-specific elongation factor